MKSQPKSTLVVKTLHPRTKKWSCWKWYEIIQVQHSDSVDGSKILIMTIQAAKCDSADGNKILIITIQAAKCLE